MLTNPKSNRIKKAAKLFRKKERTLRSEFLVEGPQAVRELLKFAPQLASDIFITETTAKKHPELIELASTLANGNGTTQVTYSSEEVIAALSETVTPQGVVAVAKIPKRAFASGDSNPFKNAKLVAVLNEVRDPGNAGAVLRSADAAGADAVIFVGDSIDPWHPKVVRSTTGSTFHLEVFQHDSLHEVITALKEVGLKTIAADVRGEDLQPNNPVLLENVAWIFGNEAHGLSEHDRNMCDEVLKLPIFGQAESLNLATAAAVCLYSSAFNQSGSRTKKEE